MLKVRNPSLQTMAGRPGPELGRVCLGISSVGDLECLLRKESLPAACSASFSEIITALESVKGSLLPPNLGLSSNH